MISSPWVFNHNPFFLIGCYKKIKEPELVTRTLMKTRRSWCNTVARLLQSRQLSSVSQRMACMNYASIRSNLSLHLSLQPSILKQQRQAGRHIFLVTRFCSISKVDTWSSMHLHCSRLTTAHKLLSLHSPWIMIYTAIVFGPHSKKLNQLIIASSNHSRSGHRRILASYQKQLTSVVCVC